jgi:rSAM/selenodomain-associated transferase 1
MKKALIVFVKAPVPGKVKTRLQPCLSPETITEIYKSFITEILEKCDRLKGISRFLGCTPTKEDDFLKSMSRDHKMRAFNQRGLDLGGKIINAFKDFLKKGYGEVVIIGSDSPTIPPDYIRMAFSELRKNDFVLGPCCDGGLYLVGAKRKITPDIFQDIPWDTSEVLNRTLRNLYSLNIKFSMLHFWYDVDTIDDLRFLENHRQYLNKKKR